MELELEDGSRLPLDRISKKEIGRGLTSKSDDPTVSRRHLILQPQMVCQGGEETAIDFEVIGRNPIWVVSNSGSDKTVFRQFEKGKLSVGDRFSLSLKNPKFVTVKGVGILEEEEEEGIVKAVQRRKMRTLAREAGETACSSGGAEGGTEEAIGPMGISDIDPVKEFGFLVVGHEFDTYSKQKIRDVRNWNWFLEESSESSDDDEVMKEGKSHRRKVNKRKKNRKGEDSGEEDWTGESEDGKVKIGGLRSSKRLRAPATRSKDKATAKESRKQKVNTGDDDETEEDEDDETLGGFIVDNEEVEEDEADLDEVEEEFNDEDEEEDD